MNPHGVRKSNFEHAMAGLEDQTPNAKARMTKHQRPNKTKHIHQMQTQLCNKQFSPWVAIIDKKYKKYVGWKHPNIYIFDKWNCGEAISDKMTGVAQATKGHTLNQWNFRDRCLHFFFWVQRCCEVLNYKRRAWRIQLSTTCHRVKRDLESTEFQIFLSQKQWFSTKGSKYNSF